MIKVLSILLLSILPIQVLSYNVKDSYGIGLFFHSFFPEIDETGYFNSFASCCSDEISDGNTRLLNGLGIALPLRYDVPVINDFTIPIIVSPNFGRYTHEFVTQKTIFTGENGNDQSLADIYAKSDITTLGVSLGTGINYFTEMIFADITGSIGFSNSNREYGEYLENADGTFRDGTDVFFFQSESSLSILFSVDAKLGYPFSLSSYESHDYILVPYLTSGFILGEIKESLYPNYYIGAGIMLYYQTFDIFASPIKPAGS